AGTLALDGQLLANGQGGSYGGAGAGGGITISVSILAGSGTMRAAGGGTNVYGGGGGGGRIAVYAQEFGTFNLSSITAPGGYTGYDNGGAGTVYIRDTDEPYGTLIIEGKYFQGGGLTPLGLRGQTHFIIPDAVVIRGQQQVAWANVVVEHPGLVLEFQRTLTIESFGRLSVAGSELVLQAAPSVTTGGLLQVSGI